MKQRIIIYGLIAGSVVSAFMATSMISMANNGTVEASGNSMIIGYLGMLIAFTFIFVAIKSYRDKQNNGAISFGRGFSIGFLVALIASTMYVITWALVYKNYLPNFMESYSEQMIQKARASLTGVELQARINDINKGKEMYASPLGFTLITYSEILPVGLLVSVVAALILKRKQRPDAAVAGA